MNFLKLFIEGDDSEEKKDSAESTLKKKLKGVDADPEKDDKGKKKDVKKPKDDKEEVDEEGSCKKKKMKECLTLEASDKDKNKDIGEDGTPQEHLGMVIDWIEQDSDGDESGEEGELEFGLIIIRDIAEYLEDDVADAVADAIVEFYGLEHYAGDDDDDEESDGKDQTEEELQELDDYVARMQRDDDLDEDLDENLDEAGRFDAKKKRMKFRRTKRKNQLGKRADTVAFKRNYNWSNKDRKFVKKKKPTSMADFRKKKRILKRIVRRKSTQIRMKRTKKRLAHVKNPYGAAASKKK